MIDEGNAWKNGRMMLDGSYTVSVKQLLRISKSVEFWEEGGVGGFKNPLRHSLCLKRSCFLFACGWRQAENKIAGKRKH